MGPISWNCYEDGDNIWKACVIVCLVHSDCSSRSVIITVNPWGQSGVLEGAWALQGLSSGVQFRLPLPGCGILRNLINPLSHYFLISKMDTL